MTSEGVYIIKRRGTGHSQARAVVQGR